MQLTPAQFSLLKLNLMSVLQHEQIACVLDSNATAAAYQLYNYEWIAGWGVAAETQILPNETATDVWKSFVQANTGKWMMGYLTYDLKNEIERLHSSNQDELGWPVLHFFVPQQLIVVDKKLNVIEGQQLVALLLNDSKINDTYCLPSIQFLHRVTPQRYCDSVNAIRQHIKDGDVYELNYCIELYAHEVDIIPEQVFAQLTEISPVPFACYYKHHHLSLMCASPERFLLKEGDKVYSQPIKGTAPRSNDVEKDAAHKQALIESEKERAENLMIVDLVRNDLARSATTGSIKVEELFGIYSFKQVHQMISTVSATLRHDVGLVDVVRHAFPMGSMTGAPKVKAMELIEQYEDTKRGLYSGCVGYIAPNGDADFNVVIRALQYHAQHHYLSMMVGSAITFDSIAEQEYNECLLKAQAMLRVFAC